MRPTIQPRQRVQYKKPRRLNIVSVSLFLVLCACAYIAAGFWPAYSLRANVKNELEDALPTVWKMNLRPDAVSRPTLTALKKSLLEKLHKMGVKDDKLDVIFQRGKARVGIEARYTSIVEFPGWSKKFVMTFTPKAETDAARVDW